MRPTVAALIVKERRGRSGHGGPRPQTCSTSRKSRNGQKITCPHISVLAVHAMLRDLSCKRLPPFLRHLCST
eukprot:6537998-Pyramimonas_sp.AAC.1